MSMLASTLILYSLVLDVIIKERIMITILRKMKNLEYIYIFLLISIFSNESTNKLLNIDG
jgi:hypothetical protein